MSAAAATAFQSSLCISSQKPSFSPTNSQEPNTHLPSKPKSLLHKHPLYSSAHHNLSLQIKEKILCLEIMGIDSGKALSLNPSLHTTSLDSLNSIISFLQSKGIHQKDFPRIFGMCPRILTSNIKTELGPVFSFLSQDLNVPENNYRKVINKCPRLLTSSVRDQLKPALFYLQRLGFKDLEALAYQDPVLLVSSVEHTLIPKLKFLESIGFSTSEAKSMVLRCPGLFTFSIENNYKPKFEYFKEEMNGDLEDLKAFPQFFAFSLEKRIKPRHIETITSGVKLPLANMLKSTDDEICTTPRKSLFGFVLSRRTDPSLFLLSNQYVYSTIKVRGGRETLSWSFPSLLGLGRQIHRSSSLIEFVYLLSFYLAFVYCNIEMGRHFLQEQLDPFSLVSDELSLVANRLRAMVIAEVPKLASAAEYFFRLGVEGKRFRPTVLLLMATALNVHIPEPVGGGVGDTVATELRARQQSIAEITEMIHVASLLHDDVLDDADTRRGIGSLNAVMGNKLAVLAGDFLLSRACVALAALKNTEVVSLVATVVENLVMGETMQMTTSSEQRCSMDYYIQKTYYKTASLISNSCKAIALLAGQTAEVAMLAFEYGKNLGLAFQLIDDVLDFTGTSASLGKGSLSDIQQGIVTAPILFAMEEFPQLHAIVYQGFDNPENIEIALEYLGKSHGIQRTRELAMKHANLAAAAIDSLPESNDENVIRSRRALVDLTQRVITRNK
ncbi:hypothetical protein Goklo_003697 [Gossypium klotzschianum]|uniref:Uncharacterized protein n=1 Tax=Gossypium klotzschianum TaxID=34286 RepID=A0A7J8VLU7_9ROSI|nr:hypothetical protein [Gossypium klotzschianum]